MSNWHCSNCRAFTPHHERPIACTRCGKKVVLFANKRQPQPFSQRRHEPNVNIVVPSGDDPAKRS